MPWNFAGSALARKIRAGGGLLLVGSLLAASQLILARVADAQTVAGAWTPNIPQTSVQESVAGGNFGISLVLDSGRASVTANWAIETIDGTATAGQDYVALNETGTKVVTAQPPDLAATYTIAITDDNFSEGDETFTIRVTSTDGSVVPMDFVVTILDDASDTETPSQPVTGGGGTIQGETSNHLVAQAEALLDTQPRLARYALDSVSGASGSLAPQGFWGEAVFSRSGSTGIAEGDHLIASLGAHGRVSDNAFLGGMLQFDRTGTELDGAGRSGEITGKGWMAGPYFVARGSSNAWHFEGRLLYGRSSNDVEGVVPATGADARNGSFDSECWLAQARIAGEYPFGSGAVMYPLADIGHARNVAEGIKGAGPNGADLDDKIRTEVSKLRLGTEFEVPLDPASGQMTFRPGLFVVVTDRDGGDSGASGFTTTGRVDLGVDYKLDDGVSLGFQGYYSGLGGESEFKSYGAGLGVQVEF